MRPLHIPRIDTVPRKQTPSTTSSPDKGPSDQASTTLQICYLFALPAEIRNRIYEEIVVHSDELWVDPEGVPIDKIRKEILTGGRRFQYLPSEPALTRTCRKIRRETLPIFYGRNIFCDTPVDLCCIKFLIYLGSKKRKMLKHLRISHWKYYAEIFLHVDAGPAGASFTDVQARLEKMQRWLQKGSLDLADDALHFLAKTQNGASSTWINCRTEESELRQHSDG